MRYWSLVPVRILDVSPRQCWPADTGAKLRDYHVARALGRHAELSYVYFSQPGIPAPSRSDLPFVRELVAVPPPARYTPKKILHGLCGRWPLPIVNYSSAEMEKAIA